MYTSIRVTYPRTKEALLNTFIAVLLVAGIVIVCGMLIKLFFNSKKAPRSRDEAVNTPQSSRPSNYSSRSIPRANNSADRSDHTHTALSSENTMSPYDPVTMQYLLGTQHDDSVRIDYGHSTCDDTPRESAHDFGSSCDSPVDHSSGSSSYDSGSSSYDGGSSSYDSGSSSSSFDSGGGGGGFD